MSNESLEHPLVNPNKNCLAGMACPQCHKFGPFRIAVVQAGTTMVYDAGTDDIDGNVEWGDESSCECLECEHTATVAEFKGLPAPDVQGNEALATQDARKHRSMLLSMLIDNLSAWEDEEQSVQEEHAKLIAATSKLVNEMRAIVDPH